MKKVLLLAFSALGLIGISGINPSYQAARAEGNWVAGENVIFNGDFAIGVDEWKLTEKSIGATSWRIWNNNESTQVVTTDPTNPENTVLRFTTYETAGFSSMFILMDNIVAGDTYDISFKFKAPEGCDNVGLAFWNVTDSTRNPEVNVLDNSQLTAAGGEIVELEDGWKQVSWTRTFASGKTFDSAHIWCNVKLGSIYFDDFTAKSEKADSELFCGGDFEGWLDDVTTTVPTEADENGIYGDKATYISGGVELAAEGFIAYETYLSESDYRLTVEAEGSVKAQFLGEESALLAEQVITSGQPVDLDNVTDTTTLKLVNTGTEKATITLVDLRPIYESTYDPSATYYESDSLTVNGDFEAFEVGTRFSDTQLEGAWGSLANFDNPARIVEVDGSKAAVIGRHDTDDTKTFSSMFLMTPDSLEIGDILRLKYDYKLTISDAADSYAEVNSSLVGGANTPYYKIDLAVQGATTTGAEKAHYAINYTTLENGWTRVTLDFEVSNDIIQWDSLRWLFTAHKVGDLLAIDNVNLHYLSTTPYTNEVTSITIPEGDQVLTVGDTKQLSYTANPADHDETTFTWASSNTSVATVDATGKVTAVAEGSAEITVTAENGVSASIIVTVTAAQGGGDTPAADNTGLIIGLSVGGAVVLIGIIAAIVIVLKKKKA